MIYDKPFIEINGKEYKLTDSDRGDNLEVDEGYTPEGNYKKIIDETASYFNPELTTAWLTKSEYEELKAELRKGFIEIGGSILSPYYHNINSNTKKCIPTIEGVDKQNNLYQITFSLEGV